MIVDVFIPCLVDQFFPQTALNMIKVLRKLGCEIRYNAEQTCCGQIAYQAGYRADARKIAEKFIKDFESTDHFIVSPSAFCVGMVRQAYAQLLGATFQQECYHLQRRMLELSEFITDVLGVDRVAGARLEGKATFVDNCYALRECGIREAPRLLLNQVEGLSLIEMKDQETCCGFGGAFAWKFPPISVGLAEQKIDHATATQADFLVSTDTACLMHLDGYIRRNRKRIQVMHLADVLASGW